MKQLVIAVICCCFLACAHAHSSGRVAIDDFEYLMGKGAATWAYIQSDEDRALLAKLKALYEKNQALQNLPDAQSALQGGKIPRVIHFIWLGPRGYPAESVENIRTWIAHNPGWKVKFWTDRPRPLPCAGMELLFVQDYQFQYLGQYYELAHDWGQKSDILRYEILFREGGVYVDHDANCLRTFAKLHSVYDFYTCLELPHEPHCGRALTSGIGIVGARPGHPVLQKTMQILAERWHTISHTSSIDSSIAAFQETISKTYMPFTLALKEAVDKAENTDIAFPAAYFYAKGTLPALYSQHFYAGAWREKSAENGFSTKINKNLSYINKNLHRNRLIAVVVLFFSLIAFGLVLRNFLKMRRV